MSCTVFKNLAHDYVLERLPRADLQRVEEHVLDCPDCAAFKRLCCELSCREFVEFLHDYLDGTLPARRREVFERHLSICSDCRSYLRSYQRTVELSVLALGEGPSPVPTPVPEELVRAILDARRQAAG